MIGDRYKFYRSKNWENFLKILKSERISADGSLICEHCGKPIVKAYDCIGHHKVELTDDNVNDATISLNPSNVQLIHFRCHNEIHKRFGYSGCKRQEVYIVWGSPCAGKTTWVNSVSEDNDIVLDIDRLWNAVKSTSCNKFYKPNALKSNVFALRDLMLDMIRVRRGRWDSAYIVGGYPFDAEREQLATRVNAKLIFIDTPKDVCLLRAKEKGAEWCEYVTTWWEEYRPPGHSVIIAPGDWKRG